MYNRLLCSNELYLTDKAKAKLSQATKIRIFNEIFADIILYISSWRTRPVCFLQLAKTLWMRNQIHPVLVYTCLLTTCQERILTKPNIMNWYGRIINCLKPQVIKETDWKRTFAKWPDTPPHRHAQIKELPDMQPHTKSFSTVSCKQSPCS